MELILRDFAAQSFGAVVLSSVTADVVGRAMLGNQPFLSLPSFAVRSPIEYLLYVALGIAVGVIGVAFSKILYLVEDACDWLWRGPEWARPAVGGLLLGRRADRAAPDVRRRLSRSWRTRSRVTT